MSLYLKIRHIALIVGCVVSLIVLILASGSGIYLGTTAYSDYQEMEALATKAKQHMYETVCSLEKTFNANQEWRLGECPDESFITQALLVGDPTATLWRGLDFAARDLWEEIRLITLGTTLSSLVLTMFSILCWLVLRSPRTLRYS